MANDIKLLAGYAQEGLIRLKHKSVMIPLVHKDFSKAFGTRNKKVSIINPATFTAKDFNGTAETQNITESMVDVTLDKFAYVDFVIDSEDEAAELGNIVELYIEPAIDAIVEKIDADVTAAASSFTKTVTGIDAEKYVTRDFINLSKKLNENKVPKANRNLVLGADAYADALDTDKIVSKSHSGSEEALRNASIGKLFGMNTYDSNFVTDGAYAFHKNSIALVTRPLKPASSGDSYTFSRDGLSLRMTKTYDATKKAEVYQIDCLYGVKKVNNNLGIKLLPGVTA